jgi:hypothetical protein
MLYTLTTGPVYCVKLQKVEGQNYKEEEYYDVYEKKEPCVFTRCPRAYIQNFEIPFIIEEIKYEIFNLNDICIDGREYVTQFVDSTF